MALIPPQPQILDPNRVIDTAATDFQIQIDVKGMQAFLHTIEDLRSRKRASILRQVVRAYAGPPARVLRKLIRTYSKSSESLAGLGYLARSIKVYVKVNRKTKQPYAIIGADRRSPAPRVYATYTDRNGRSRTVFRETKPSRYLHLLNNGFTHWLGTRFVGKRWMQSAVASTQSESRAKAQATWNRALQRVIDDNKATRRP